MSFVNENAYCKNKYCCIQSLWSVYPLNKCYEDNLCCPFDSMCIEYPNRTTVEDSTQEPTTPIWMKIKLKKFQLLKQIRNQKKKVTGSYKDEDISQEVTDSYEDEDISQEITGLYNDKDSSKEITYFYTDEDSNNYVKRSYIDEYSNQEVTGSYKNKGITQEITTSYTNKDSSYKAEPSHSNEGCRGLISHKNFDLAYLYDDKTFYCKNEHCCFKNNFIGEIVKCSDLNFCCPNGLACYRSVKRNTFPYPNRKPNKITTLQYKLEYKKTTTPQHTTDQHQPNKDCEEEISYTNYDLKMQNKYFIKYCKNDYCCNYNYGYYISGKLNKCQNKQFCCTRYRYCEHRPKITPTPSTQAGPTHKTLVYFPKKDILLHLFGPTFAVGTLILLALILRKAFVRCTSNQNTERAADDQSDVRPPPSYSQVCFDNMNYSIDMRFGRNQQNDDQKFSVNYEDGLPSYESLKVLPSPYMEESRISTVY